MTSFNLAAIGNRIRKARCERALTQQELAKLVGKSKQLVSAWEAGRAEPLVTSLAHLGMVLSVDVTWILYGTRASSALPALPDGKLIPLLPAANAVRYITGKLSVAKLEGRTYVSKSVSDRAFALRAPDEGVAPTIAKDDLIIVDPQVEVAPGMVVAAAVLSEHGKMLSSPALVVRKVHFKGLSRTSGAYQLVATQSAYATIDIFSPEDAVIAGPVVGIHKFGTHFA